MKLTVDKAAGRKFKQNLAGIADRWEAALTAAANMAAAMIEDQARQDMAASGHFSNLADGLHVKVEGAIGNMRIAMYADDPRIALFEEGGTIEGNPLLWIPISGTDAEGVHASEYPEQLFSVQSYSGRPLLMSVADKLPKYFGIEEVTIPKKFHLRDIQKSVMANFRQIFDAQFRAT